jgi:hypothetical protein
MKKIILLGVVLLNPITLLSQSNDMLFYYPDGRLYKRACNSIIDINGDFDKDGRIKIFSPMCWDSTRYDCFTVIGYRLFTDEPLWVFTNSSEEIPHLVKAFNFQEYLRSSQLDHDLKDHITKETLTDDFILETLGVPDKSDIVDEGRKNETWTYSKLGLVLGFEDGLLTAYQRFLYKEIQEEERE